MGQTNRKDRPPDSRKTAMQPTMSPALFGRKSRNDLTDCSFPSPFSPPPFSSQEALAFSAPSGMFDPSALACMRLKLNLEESLLNIMDLFVFETSVTDVTRVWLEI